MIRWPCLSLVLLPSRPMLVAAVCVGVLHVAVAHASGQDRPPTLESDPGALAVQGSAANTSAAGSRSTSSFRRGLVSFEREPVTADTAPIRVYTAAIGPGGRVRLVVLRDAGLNPGQFDPVPLHVRWSAEQAVVGQPGLTGVEPVAVAVDASAVVLVSTSGQPGNAVITAFSKTDGSVLWTTPAIVPSAGLSAFEPAGAAIVVAEGNPGNTITPPVLLVGGTGTITGGARVPVVVGWRLIEQPQPTIVPPVIAGSPLIAAPAAGFRDEVTVARPLLSGQEGRPSAAVLGLGLAGTRLEMPGGTSDWFVRVAHVTNPQSPTLAWRWPAPAIVDFDAYDVPTDLCMGGRLNGDAGLCSVDKPENDTIYVVGTSRGTPNGPRTARLRTFSSGTGAAGTLIGTFTHQEGAVAQDVNALSIAYSANVDDDGPAETDCDKRGVFVTGSIGPIGGPTQTIVMSWAGPVSAHGIVPGTMPPQRWPLWAAVPPGSIQGGGRVADGGLVVVAPAPPEPSPSVSPRTVLLTIGSWTDTQGTTHWRLMRWRPERPQP